MLQNLFLILVTSLENITVGSALGSGSHRVAQHSNTKSSPKSQECFIQDTELKSAIILVLITKSFTYIMSFFPRNWWPQLAPAFTTHVFASNRGKLMQFKKIFRSSSSMFNALGIWPILCITIGLTA